MNKHETTILNTDLDSLVERIKKYIKKQYDR